MQQKGQLPVVVVGSVAIDWVITPHAERQVSVGGAATYFSLAASYFAPIQLVGVVGGDFPQAALSDLREAGVDLAGLEVIDDGLTFRWKGKYRDNLNERDTLETHLNCFEAFSPKLPDSYRASDFLFLANIQPGLQEQVLSQMSQRPKFVGLDTMNLWIDIAADQLRSVLAKVDLLAINEEEALQLAGTSSLPRAAREIRQLGPKYLVVKRGQYGALLFGPEGDVFSVPALVLDDVADPTGAGDSFAGGMMGHLAAANRFDERELRRSLVTGTTMASFCVQGFSYDRLLRLTQADIAKRWAQIERMTQF